MANLKINGFEYANVPAVDFPTVDGGTVRFVENLANLQMGVLRSDAELVKTWSKDSLIVADDGVTLPAYSTSQQLVVASASLDGIIMDHDNYNYYALIRTLTIPVYNTSTPVQGRVEYSMSSGIYEVVDVPAGTLKSLVGNKTYNNNAKSIVGSAFYRMLYWNSDSSISVSSSQTYGTYQSLSAPSFANTTFNVSSPALYFRSSSGIMQQSVYNTITDVRMQYVIQLYRAPKGNLNIDGWGMYTQFDHIADCANSASHTLT